MPGGTWVFKNPQGKGKLKLEKKRGNVSGDILARKGKKKLGWINGDLKRRGFVWKGHYRNTDAGNGGTFKAKLSGDLRTFSGWFKFCGRFTCGDKIDWSGKAKNTAASGG